MVSKMQSFNFVLRVQADESGIVYSGQIDAVLHFGFFSCLLYGRKKPYCSCVISYLAYECKRALF